MYKLSATGSSLTLIALLIGGCGGGSSDDTAVSGAPDAPSPVAEVPAPPPVAAVPAPPPAPEPAPVPTVSGEVVWAALQTGISPDPEPIEPVTNYRKVYTDAGEFIHLGGDADALDSHTFTSSSWGPLIKDRLVRVSLTGSDGVIDAVTANDLPLVGPQLDLRNVDPAVDATAGTWSNGAWSAQLIVQSVESPDLMRVCWNVHLPPPAPVRGPPGVPVTPPDTVPLKRLMCGVYSRAQAGPDVGGYVVDDFNGTKRAFRGTWQE